jgi:DNA-binding winged helix-turn-helix (wHTH) protein/Tol biopolymer transport system component
MGSKSFVFRFDDVEVREREFSLVKADQALTVEPKAFRVLLFLLRNPQRLVSKEELLNAVWGEVAVGDGSLTRCIWLLRNALGDDTRSPRYIETVATVGYRFVGKVEVSEDASGRLGATDGTTAETAANSHVETDEKAAVYEKEREKDKDGKRRRFWTWLLPSGGLIAVGIAATIWYMRRPLPPPRISEYIRLTHDARERTLAGTDGSRLYFTQVSPLSIAQVAVTGGEIAPVPVSVPGDLAYLLDVSRDGSSFLVASEQNGNPNLVLWNVRVLGGAIRRLGNAQDGAFSPDGNSVAYSTIDGDIYFVRSDGTNAHKLASTKGTTNHLAWSPDGTTIRFDKDGKLWEISSSGSNLHPLLPGWQTSSFQCCGSWTPNGEFFVFLSSDFQLQYRPQGQLWALDERRGLFRKPPAEPIQLTSGPILWNRPVPSQDGKRIFASGVTRRGELVRFDPASKQLKPYLSGISAESVTFSKDGKSVAYVSFRDGVLWKADSDGTNPVQLIDLPIHPEGPRWSPDGTQILFMDVSSDLHTSMYVVSSEGGSPRRLMPEDDGKQTDPDWSPDGTKVVFGTGAGRFRTRENLKILDLTSHQIKTVPGSVAMWYPRWSPDGRYIVAKAWDSPSLNIFDIETQRWSTRLTKGDWFWPAWSRDSRFVYFLLLSNRDQGLFRTRVKGDETEQVVDLKDWHLTGWSGNWMDLDPSDAPMLLRDIGSDDIYALALEQK